MMFTGQGFSSTPGRLEAVTLAQLAERIQKPEPLLRELVQALRGIRSLDAAAYRKRKTALPWFIGAEFIDGLRRQENLVQIDHFTLDLDHCRENGFDPARLSQNLRADARVALAFVSPSGNGVKCVFTLEGPIRSPKVFSDFYRSFAREFAETYGLTHIADQVTSDVARVCFLSHDPQAWHNPAAVPVNWRAYGGPAILPPPAIPFEGDPPAVVDLGDVTGNPLPKKGPQEPDKEVMSQIRKTLKPPSYGPPKTPPALEAPLAEVKDALVAALQQAGLEVTAVQPIQYGLKVSVRTQQHAGEVNVFHGKKGFSIVPVPKSGVHPEVNHYACEVIHKVLFPPPPHFR